MEKSYKMQQTGVSRELISFDFSRNNWKSIIDVVPSKYNWVWKYFIQINIIYIQHYISETYQASTLGILPMFHIFGIGVVTMHTLAVGGKMTTLPGFDPQTFLATLAITKVLNQKYSLLYFCT